MFEMIPNDRNYVYIDTHMLLKQKALKKIDIKQ